jgi:hypothetical protein
MTLDIDALPEHVPLRAHASHQDKRRDLEHHINRRLSELNWATEAVARSASEKGNVDPALSARIEEIWKAAGLSYVQSSNLGRQEERADTEGSTAPSLGADTTNVDCEIKGDLVTELSELQANFDEAEWMSMQYQYLLRGE